LNRNVLRGVPGMPLGSRVSSRWPQPGSRSRGAAARRPILAGPPAASLSCSGRTPSFAYSEVYASAEAAEKLVKDFGVAGDRRRVRPSWRRSAIVVIIRHALRAGDAIQLASALWLQEATGEPLAGVMAFDTAVQTATRPPEQIARAHRRASYRAAVDVTGRLWSLYQLIMYSAVRMKFDGFDVVP
jgi:hypothetical protein